MITVTGLKVENLSVPRGLGTAFPRFSWRTETTLSDCYQAAYRIRVFEQERLFWDSGVVESSESVLIEGCPRIAGQTCYFWQVSVKYNGQWYDSEKAVFETGMLNKVWKGQWIAGIHNGEAGQPVNYLRKSFVLEKTVKRARLYSTALGVYDCAINGLAVSDECFAPGWTDYFVRVQHQTYDVTTLLHPGKNAIGVRLGEGWYCGSISRRRNSNQPSYGTIPVFRGELHITFNDDTTQVIPTDASWLCSIGGPIRMSDIYDGEIYDARFQMGTWNTADYPEYGWTHCLLKNRRIRIDGQTAPPVRRTKWLSPAAVYDIAPALWKREPNIPDPHRLTIIDFGQNLVGRVKLRIRLKDGVSITIRHGEMLNADGSIFLDNLRSARSAVRLTGNGEWFDYEPLFTFFGFRYLQITNLPEDFDPSTCRAAVIHTDLERTGYFHCSDSLLNKLYANQLWSNRGNYLDIPTDCPQRDERLGWLADAWIFADAASYNFKISGFFEKYLADVNTSCTGYGEYPQYAPFFAVNHLDAEFFGTEYYKGHSAWADAAIICPWILYQKYHDRRPLKRHYEKMKDWILFQKENSDHLIRCSCVWRDWLNHNDPTSEELISTAFFAYGTSLMQKIAVLLGHKQDADEFETLWQNIRNAFCKNFITDKGELAETSQTAALLTLQFDLAPEEIRPIILGMLVKNLEQRQYRLSTGFLGTPFLLPVLTRFGRSDLAAKLLMQKEFPSWLYPVLQGATTIWERWDGYTMEKGILPQPMNSFNHYAYGAVAAYMYSRIGGILPDDGAVAFHRFIIEPVFCGLLSSAETHFDSPYGKISTVWYVKNGNVSFTLVVPPNTTALVRLPQQPEKELGAGKYHFSFPSQQ